MAPFNKPVEVGSVLSVVYSRDGSRSVRVVAAADSAVAAPSLSPSAWLFPCDIVGFDSKKAKAAKIRFHPESFEKAAGDQRAAEAMAEAIHQLLAVMCSSGEWSQDRRPSTEVCRRAMTKWRRFFAASPPHVSFDAREMHLNWPLSPPSSCGSKQARSIREVAALLAEGTPLQLRARVSSEDGDGQTLHIQCHKGEVNTTVWRLRLDKGYLAEPNESIPIQVCPRGVRLATRRSECTVEEGTGLPPSLPSLPLSAAVVDEAGRETHNMLEVAQCRVEDLRRRLDESLASFQKAAAAKDDPRSRNLFLSTGDFESIIEIIKPGGIPRGRLALSSFPLNVIVGQPLSPMGSYASSPAESTDSGVSLSPPSLSPLMAAKSSPFYQYSEEAKLVGGMRARSLSESSPAMLKGILKKPGQKRAAPAGLSCKSRSLSESRDDEPFHFHRSLTLDSECLEELVEGEEEEEEEESVTELVPEMQPRMKRVSFSDNIQKRSFRPNSSILGQKKKNERKARSKKRKQERRASEGDAESYQEGVTDENQSEGDEEREGGGVKEFRKDSGFEDEEEEERERDAVFENGDRGWLRLVRAQRQRWHSASQ